MLVDAGTGGQGLLQPVEANFFDFDPSIAHGLEAALLECLAIAVAVKQGKAAVSWAWGEQRNEKAHGDVPCEGLLRRMAASRYVQVYGG
jgi:hypothetical protein